MALVFKVNGRDLSSYLRVNHGDGLDPAPGEFMDPQYAGSAAMGEGQFFVGDAVNNSAKVFPLILKAATTDLLYQLIRDIRADLAKGNQVEYRSGGASASTFFDLEGGVLDPDFEFWLDQGKRCRATLTIHTRPYGHTGTTRLLASTVGTGAINVLASGLSGDMDAVARITVGMATKAYNSPLVLYGVKHPVPSGWSPEWRGASISLATSIPNNNGEFNGYATAARSLVGASGAMASQYVAFGLAAATNYSVNAQLGEFNLPPLSHVGKHRIIAGVRSYLSVPSAKPELSLYFDPVGNVRFSPSAMQKTGKTSLRKAALSGASGGFNLVDFGEINVPTSSASAAPFAMFGYSGASLVAAASTGGANASYPIQIEGLYLIPADKAIGVFVHPKSVGSAPINTYWAVATGRGGTSTLTLDGVDRSVFYRSGSSADPAVNGLRGDFPNIPATPSAARVVVLAAGQENPVYFDTANPIINWVAHDPVSVGIEVRERFTYLR